MKLLGTIVTRGYTYLMTNNMYRIEFTFRGLGPFLMQSALHITAETPEMAIEAFRAERPNCTAGDVYLAATDEYLLTAR